MEEKNKENAIVPSYMKKNKEESNNKNKSKKKSNKKKLKIILLITGMIVAILLLVFLISFIVRVIKYSKYDEYSLQIKNYALAKMFDNEKATSYDSVKKSEAIKFIISSITNLEKIEFNNDIKYDYKNQEWVEYAIKNSIIKDDEINKSNQDDKITYIEFITYYANARKALLNQELDTSVYPKFSDIKNITNEQLYALSDLISKGIIENNEGKIKPHRKLYKGELNKIACEIIKGYDLLVPEGDMFNINEDRNPSNMAEYPYILFNVDKEAYEKPFIVKDQDKFRNPVTVFDSERIVLDSIASIVNEYYNTILNVNYENIDRDSFYNKLSDNALFEIDSQEIDEYIKYVKDNNIKIEGTAKSQLPIIYYDGIYFRIRVKLDFKIISANSRENILYDDINSDENNYKYDKDSYSFYIDAKIGKPTSSHKIMYVWGSDIYSQKTDESIEGITVTEKVVDDELVI